MLLLRIPDPQYSQVILLYFMLQLAQLVREYPKLRFRCVSILIKQNYHKKVNIDKCMYIDNAVSTQDDSARA